MTILKSNPEAQTFWSVVKRGLRGRCPQCGQGRLFSCYLKNVDHCPECHEDFSHIKADDGPAWLTILVIGHILVPAFIYASLDTAWPTWVMMFIFILLTFGLVLITLPWAKGLFIALIWRTRCADGP